MSLSSFSSELGVEKLDMERSKGSTIFTPTVWLPSNSKYTPNFHFVPEETNRHGVVICDVQMSV
jgi:hypothetical protein